MSRQGGGTRFENVCKRDRVFSPLQIVLLALVWHWVSRSVFMERQGRLGGMQVENVRKTISAFYSCLSY